MNKDIEEVLLSEEQLKEKTAEIARQICEDYHDKDFIMVTQALQSYEDIKLVNNVNQGLKIK